MPRTRPPYPAAFRQQILELAHAGRTPAELSREFNVTAQTITNWVAQDARDRGAALPGKEGLNLNPAVTPPPSSPQAVLAARSSGQCDHRYSATDKPRDPPA